MFFTKSAAALKQERKAADAPRAMGLAGAPSYLRQSDLIWDAKRQPDGGGLFSRPRLANPDRNKRKRYG